MKRYKTLLNATLIALMIFSLSSCFENEDPGPLQEQELEYSILDFNRLEIGDAMNVTVEQGAIFEVKVNGDRRNLDDLDVGKIGNTLRMSYKNSSRSSHRQYTTYVNITMPFLEGAIFSGAVTSKVTGFTSDGSFDLTISGASSSQVAIEAAAIKLNLSGASELNLSGLASDLDAIVSGASHLRAFDFEVETATVEASGASKVKVFVHQVLNADASGASQITYRGTPTLKSSTSGASTIGAD